MWLVVLSILEKHLIHIRAGILIEFVAAAENDEGNLAVTQDRQLVRFLHYSKFAFVKSYLSIPFIRDSGYLYFFTTHGSNFEERTKNS